MKIQIGYFALLREQAGLAQEVWETEGQTPKDVFRELRQHYGFTLQENQVKVAVNDQFTEFDRPLNEGDRLVFIPPVAGG